MIIINLEDYNVTTKAIYDALFDVYISCNKTLAKCNETKTRSRENHMNYSKNKTLASTKLFSKGDFDLQLEVDNVIK